MGLFLARPRRSTLRASTTVELLYVPRAAFIKLMQQFPDLAELAARRIEEEMASFLGAMEPFRDAALRPAAAAVQPSVDNARRARTQLSRNVTSTGTWSDGLSLQPRAGPEDLGAIRAGGDVGGRPDVVEPAALVGGVPVLGAIAPPGIELLVVRDVLAHQVDPADGRREQGVERLGLDRGVADHIEQLLVAPHVVLVRGDVEIAADQLAGGEIRRIEPGLEFGKEIELVLELRIDLRVGHVAAGRNVEIVHGQRAAAEIEPAPRRGASSSISQKRRLLISVSGSRETMATP